MAFWTNKKKDNEEHITTEDLITSMTTSRVSINPEYMKNDAKRCLVTLIQAIYAGNENALPMDKMTDTYYKQIRDNLIRDKNNGIEKKLYNFQIKNIKPTNVDNTMMYLVTSVEFEIQYVVSYSAIHSTFNKTHTDELKVRYLFMNGSNYPNKKGWIIDKETDRRVISSVDFDVKAFEQEQYMKQMQTNQAMYGYPQNYPQGYGQPTQQMPVYPQTPNYNAPMQQGFPQAYTPNWANTQQGQVPQTPVYQQPIYPNVPQPQQGYPQGYPQGYNAPMQQQTAHMQPYQNQPIVNNMMQDYKPTMGETTPISNYQPAMVQQSPAPQTILNTDVVIESNPLLETQGEVTNEVNTSEEPIEKDNLVVEDTSKETIGEPTEKVDVAKEEPALNVENENVEEKVVEEPTTETKDVVTDNKDTIVDELEIIEKVTKVEETDIIVPSNDVEHSNTIDEIKDPIDKPLSEEQEKERKERNAKNIRRNRRKTLEELATEGEIEDFDVLD